MEIQNTTNNIRWQQLTAKEILQMKDEGVDVPNQYQTWATAISAVMDVKDDVTYEMVNGETDIAAIEEIFGKEDFAEVTPPEDAENSTDNEEDRAMIPENPQAEEEAPNVPEDFSLANEEITADPNEMLKRKLRKGTL